MGALLAVTAALCWAIGAILARLGLQGGIKASTGTFISTISSLVLLGGLLPSFSPTQTSVEVSTPSWLGS